MKKQLIKVAILATGMLALASCNKEEVVVKAATNQNAIANRVIFESVEEYENLFEDPKTIDQKTNEVAARFGTYNEAARVGTALEDTLYPEVLQKILNDDHVVQIGQWLIKVDVAKQQVLVLDKKYLDQYSDLASSNLDNKNILVYSTEDEVLEMLQNQVKPSAARTSGLFCRQVKNRDPNLGPNILIESITSSSGLIGQRYIQPGVDYSSYGIYYKLYGNVISKFQQNGTFGFYSYNIPSLTIGCAGSWKINCKNDGSIGNEFTLSNTYENLYTFYSGAKSISKSDVRIIAKSYLTNGSIHETPIFYDSRSN